MEKTECGIQDDKIHGYLLNLKNYSIIASKTEKLRDKNRFEMCLPFLPASRARVQFYRKRHVSLYYTTKISTNYLAK